MLSKFILSKLLPTHGSLSGPHLNFTSVALSCVVCAWLRFGAR